MAVSSVQLYMVFQKLFKTDNPTKDQVLQHGVLEPDFGAADIDSNEYLSLEEGFNSHTVSEFLYETAVSAFGTAIVNSDISNQTDSPINESQGARGEKSGFGTLTKRAF